MFVSTADWVDLHGESLGICDLQLRDYGKSLRFSGPVRTLEVFEDNALIKSTLSTPGSGAILVVDGGGSLHCALVGDVIAGLAFSNGWAGIVLNGAIRDSVALKEIGIGIKALGSNPRKSAKAGVGALDATLQFGGIAVRSGDWLYSDEDGLVVSATPLSAVTSATPPHR